MRVTLLEHALTIKDVGAGIQITPNASRILRTFGLLDAAASLATRPGAVTMRTWSSGRTVYTSPMGDAALSKYDAPYLNVHRADLHSALLKAAIDTGQIDLRLGASCVDIRQHTDQATAVIDTGESFSADILVGADGIKSQVRQIIHGPDSPRFTGCVAWRALVPAQSVANLGLAMDSTLWMGPRGHFVHYYVRGGALLNFVAVTETRGWEIESWNQPADLDEVKQTFARWNPQVQSIIAAAPQEACFKWALFDRKPMTRWSHGRVTLLGDACHATLPFLAQGACMAIEDAAVLAECMSRSTAQKGLLKYEALRRARTAGVQKLSWLNKTVFHLRGPSAWLRDQATSLAPSQLSNRLDELYGHDAIAAANQ